MVDSLTFSVSPAKWPEDAPALREVRTAVFIVEQGVPPDLEWDDLDVDCAHVLARDADGRAIGTGRLLPHRKKGRMAVVQRARGQGVGAAIMQALLAMARERGDAEVELSAQTHALGFYEKFGFVAFGDEYLDVGIPHRSMRLRLTER
jgi:predicted GNAT family N-acyltransferase